MSQKSDWLADWVTGWLTDWVTGWVTDELVPCLMDLLQKRIVVQLVTFLAICGTRRFITVITRVSALYYPEPDESNPHSPTLCDKTHLNIILPFLYFLSICRFSLDFTSVIPLFLRVGTYVTIMNVALTFHEGTLARLSALASRRYSHHL
jgi:hypothetical protein